MSRDESELFHRSHESEVTLHVVHEALNIAKCPISLGYACIQRSTTAHILLVPKATIDHNFIGASPCQRMNFFVHSCFPLLHTISCS